MHLIKASSLALLGVAASVQNVQGLATPQIPDSTPDIEAGNSTLGASSNSTDLGVSENSTDLGALLGGPFNTRFTDDITCDIRWLDVPLDAPAANDLIHVYLSFARQQWEKKWSIFGPSQGSYNDPDVPGSRIAWGIENVHHTNKAVVLGWGAILAAQDLLIGGIFPSDSPTLRAAKHRLRWKNIVDGVPYAEIRGEIRRNPNPSTVQEVTEPSDTSGTPSTNVQTSKGDLIARQDNSTTSLGVTQSNIQIVVSDQLVSVKIPRLDLLSIITETLALYIYHHQPSTDISRIWDEPAPGARPELETVKYRGLILTFAWYKVKAGTTPFKITDLEETLRNLVLTPYLQRPTTTTFTASAHMADPRGGFGPAFIEINVYKNSVVGDSANLTVSGPLGSKLAANGSSTLPISSS